MWKQAAGQLKLINYSKVVKENLDLLKVKVKVTDLTEQNTELAKKNKQISKSHGMLSKKVDDLVTAKYVH